MASDLLESENAADLWSQVIQFDKPLSHAAARALLHVNFSSADRQRMTDLAAKARHGTLSAKDEQLAVTYERLGCLLDILHSKARQALRRRGRTAS